MTLFLGVDGGGTKTHALVADQAGTVLGIGRSGPSNWETVGVDGTREALRVVVEQALKGAAARASEVAAATFGLGGIDWPSDVARLAPAVAPLGLPGPVDLLNDSFVALAAGTNGSAGVVVVAGTGTVAAGRNAKGETFRTLGLGADYGEFGSAGDVSRAALAAVASSFTGAGPATTLTERLLELTGCGSVAEMLEMVSRGRIPMPESAPAVAEAAEAGDPVAEGILARVGRSLGTSAGVVARRLDIHEGRFDVVLAGGLFRSGSRILEDAVAGEIRRVAPFATMAPLRTPPVVGAAVMAMTLLGLEAPVDVQRRLAEGASSELAGDPAG